MCYNIFEFGGTKMAKTIYDISKELNVAPSTVSKALNGRSGISDNTRKKILDYANKVRYYANSNASKLKTKKSFSIGVVYSEDLDIGLEHNFFSSVLQSFKTYVESQGYEITFVISNLGNRKISYHDFCRQKNIDGVFIVTSLYEDPHLQELVESGIACVSTDIYYKNLFTVISDNMDGARQAVEYFYQTGHTKIGHITESHFSPAAAERYQGFVDTMNALNLPVEEKNIIATDYYSFDEGYKAGKKFLELEDYPTAVFVAADIIAMGFIKALKDGGRKVPEDVSVIGFDDLEFAALFEPSLSTIRQDTKLLGKKAALKLLELMDKKIEKRQVVEKIPVELVVRDSVKRPKQ